MRQVLVGSLFFFTLFPLAAFARVPMSPIRAVPSLSRAAAGPSGSGPQRSPRTICTETGLLKEWPKAGPKLLWDSSKVNQAKSVGVGISSLAITQGKIFTLGDFFVETKVEAKKDDKKDAKKRSCRQDGRRIRVLL